MDYYMKMTNETSRDFCMVIYKKSYASPGMDIAWKVADLPPPSSKEELGWQSTFSLTVLDSAGVSRSVELGLNYKLVTDDAGLLRIVQDTSIPGTPGQITFANLSGTPEEKTLGFSIAGAVASMHKTPGNERTTFKYEPNYYIAAYDGINVKAGSVIPEPTLGPVVASYTAELDCATLGVVEAATGYQLTTPVMSHK